MWITPKGSEIGTIIERSPKDSVAWVKKNPALHRYEFNCPKYWDFCKWDYANIYFVVCFPWFLLISGSQLIYPRDPHMSLVIKSRPKNKK